MAGGIVPNPHPLYLNEPALSHRQWLVRRLLPTISFSLVAATGNMYYGLWYPIVISLMTVIIGALFLRETKDVDIRA